MEPNVPPELYIQIALNLKGDDFINFIKTHKNMHYNHDFWVEKFENDQLPILTHLLPNTLLAWLKEYTKVYKIKEYVEKFMKTHAYKIATDEDINKYEGISFVYKRLYYIPPYLPLNDKEHIVLNDIIGEQIDGENITIVLDPKDPLIKLKLMQIYYYAPNIYNYIMNYYELNRYFYMIDMPSSTFWF